MVWSKNGKRNYREEYAKWQGTEKAKKERAQRNAARRAMIKAGKAKKGDGKDVGHRTAISKGGKNGLANLFMQSKSANRSFSRGANGNMRSERSKRER